VAGTPEALVEPGMLRWARATSGLDVPVVAKRVQVRPEQVANWEDGSSRPSIAQLRRLAQTYKRPLASFFLPHPPVDSPLPTDFRRPTGAPTALSPALRLAHRQALHRRDVALELAQACGVEIGRFALVIAPEDDVEPAARALRDDLGVAVHHQAAWGDEHQALRAWRAACEAAGVMVCQVPQKPEEKMSGLSVPASPLPVVVLNSSDHVHRRIFTLIHEVAHLAAHEGALCDTSADVAEGYAAEARCNAIAAAALVPTTDLLRQEVVARHGGSPGWSDIELGALARRYRVSREVVLRRLLVLGLATDDFYGAKRSQFAEEYVRATKRGSGGPKPAVRAVGRGGPLFARLVLSAYGSDVVTLRDVCEHLGVGPKHLDEVAERAFGWKDSAGGERE